MVKDNKRFLLSPNSILCFTMSWSKLDMYSRPGGMPDTPWGASIHWRAVNQQKSINQWHWLMAENAPKISIMQVFDISKIYYFLYNFAYYAGWAKFALTWAIFQGTPVPLWIFGTVEYPPGRILVNVHDLFLDGDLFLAREGLRKFRPMPVFFYHWARRHLCLATPAVSRDLGFAVLSEESPLTTSKDSMRTNSN